MTVAPPNLKKRFFALGRLLRIDADRLKKRAKKIYKLESFAQITTEQIEPLITALENEVEVKLEKCPTCLGTGYIKKEILENERPD